MARQRQRVGLPTRTPRLPGHPLDRAVQAQRLPSSSLAIMRFPHYPQPTFATFAHVLGREVSPSSREQPLISPHYQFQLSMAGAGKSSSHLRTASGDGSLVGQMPLPSPDGLIALDHLCWLGSGRDVAQRLQCNPSTVSRKAETCAVNLGLLLRKRSGLWTLYGDTELLLAERYLHQRYRLAGYLPLRLEVSADLAERLQDPPHSAWISGGQRHFATRRPLELLEQRVTDAWLCSFCEELNLDGATSWQVLEIATLPLQLLAHGDHPLVAQAGLDGVDGSALRSCPCLALPAHCQPQRQALLQRLGLANQLLNLERHDGGKWDDPLNDRRTIRPGTPLDLLQRNDWQALPLPLPHEARLGLVIRRDLEPLKPIQELHSALRVWFDHEIYGAAAPLPPAPPGTPPAQG